MLKEMWNFERSTVVIVTPFVLIMKDKVKELSNLGLRAFTIVAGDEEVFASSLKMIHGSAILRTANLLEFVAQD